MKNKKKIACTSLLSLGILAGGSFVENTSVFAAPLESNGTAYAIQKGYTESYNQWEKAIVKYLNKLKNPMPQFMIEPSSQFKIENIITDFKKLNINEIEELKNLTKKMNSEKEKFVSNYVNYINKQSVKNWDIFLDLEKKKWTSLVNDYIKYDTIDNNIKQQIAMLRLMEHTDLMYQLKKVIPKESQPQWFNLNTQIRLTSNRILDWKPWENQIIAEN
ncbi:hypothetical protein Q0O06_29110 [Bacillus thuringiensis]|uniref:hypothetical protein n=1 Tax=Bacillus thuringiensis TaxID=1428 RepID=UPI003459A0C9